MIYKSDAVYSQAAEEFSLPPEVPPPDRWLHWAACETATIQITAERLAKKLPNLWKDRRLVWCDGMKSDRGREVGGRAVITPDVDFIALSSELVYLHPAWTPHVVLHELAHSLGLKDEAAATRYAWRYHAAILRALNSDLERGFREDQLRLSQLQPTTIRVQRELGGVIAPGERGPVQ